jgi:hypothetical protein
MLKPNIVAVQEVRSEAAVNIRCKKNLLTLIEAQAAFLCISPEVRAKRLLEEACIEFQARTLSESPYRLLDIYKQDLESIEESETVDIQVPLARSAETIMNLTGSAYGISTSDLASRYLAATLFSSNHF